jgi:GNAT superfamily N-acetyltransferase
MKAYSHKHRKAQSLAEAIPEATSKAEAMNLPYWIIAEDSDSFGVVIVGQEPLQLTASPGTPVALVALEPSKASSKDLPDFISTVIELVAKRDVANALVTLPFKHRQAVRQFMQAGFEAFDDYYLMSCPLSRHVALTTDLQFEPVKFEDVREWFSTATGFLTGTADTALMIALQYMPNLPDAFLAQYYAAEKLYFVTKGATRIGILDIHGTNGWIGNMAVESHRRRQGYGRQILIFALKQLQTRGCGKAGLRVHVHNKPAIQLYGSVGFKKTARCKRLLWWNTRRSAP